MHYAEQGNVFQSDGSYSSVILAETYFDPTFSANDRF